MNFYPYISPQPFQAWMILYMVILLGSVLVLTAGLVTSTFDRYSISYAKGVDKVIVMAGALGLLLLMAYPFNILALYLLLSIMYTLGAPISALIISSIFAIGSFVLFTICTFPWAFKSRKASP